MGKKISVIIVTHNSKRVLKYCLNALRQQTLQPFSIIIVDSGSENSEYLDEYHNDAENIVVLKSVNVGFAVANNLGYRALDNDISFVVFCNPDAFLAQDVLAKAYARITTEPWIACVTGRMLGFDIDIGQPTGLLDSSGVFRKWYGRWHDRGHGEVDTGQYLQTELVPAGCGAFLFCRKAALEQCLVNGRDVFDPDFFMYKEDIELGLRLKRGGWQILYHPDLIIYHCRGWKKDRLEISLSMRRMAAKNEILLYLKHPSIYIFWGLLKYMLVRVFRF